MHLSPVTLEEKPYNRCIACDNIGVKCDGPNFLAMDTDRWCEWCRIRKEHLRWTNSKLAEVAEVSKVTVDRVMVGNCSDLRVSTMQSITKALVNGTWGQYPCANPEAVAELEKSVCECNRLKEKLNGINEEMKKELESVRAEGQRKIDFLTAQISVKDKHLEQQEHLLENMQEESAHRDKRKMIALVVVSTLFVLCLLAIIAALVVDAMNPDKGFFWLND